MYPIAFSSLLLLGLGLVSCEDSINADVVNTRVQRTIDLTTHLVKISSRITVENTGKSGIRSYLIAVEPSLARTLSFVGATVS